MALTVDTHPEHAEALEADLAAIDADGSTPPPQRFVVDSDSRASWALEKYTEHCDECDRIQQLAAERIADIERWATEMQKTHEQRMGHLSALLEAYLIGTGRKTLKLPDGEIGRRAMPTHIERDEAALTDWLVEAGYDQYLKPAALAWKQLRDACEVRGDGLFLAETGERVPTAVVTDGGERFAIRLRRDIPAPGAARPEPSKERKESGGGNAL